MDLSPILPETLFSNTKYNFGWKYRAEFRYMWTKLKTKCQLDSMAYIYRISSGKNNKNFSRDCTNSNCTNSNRMTIVVTAHSQGKQISTLVHQCFASWKHLQMTGGVILITTCTHLIMTPWLSSASILQNISLDNIVRKYQCKLHGRTLLPVIFYKLIITTIWKFDILFLVWNPFCQSFVKTLTMAVPVHVNRHLNYKRRFLLHFYSLKARTLCTQAERSRPTIRGYLQSVFLLSACGPVV